MSANIESELERESWRERAVSCGRGETGRKRGPWPHGASWPRFLPVFAGPELSSDNQNYCFYYTSVRGYLCRSRRCFVWLLYC